MLSSADSLRTRDAEVESALEHALGCPDCKTILESDRRIARLVGDAVARASAPPGLRDRVRATLAAEGIRRPDRTLTWRNWRVAGLGAAGLAALLSLVVVPAVITQVRSSRTDPAIFVEDFLSREPRPDERVMRDPGRATAFFSRTLGVAIQPPVLPEFELRLASVGELRGHRAGVVEYEGQAGRLSHYLLLTPERGGRPPARRTTVAVTKGVGETPSSSSVRELAVSTWRDARHQHALVGDISAERLDRMAPLFACPPSRL